MRPRKYPQEDPAARMRAAFESWKERNPERHAECQRRAYDKWYAKVRANRPPKPPKPPKPLKSLRHAHPV